MDSLTFARLQMGLSLAFHMMFAAVGIALPVLMVIVEGLWLRTGRPHYRARSTLQVLTLLESPPNEAADQGSNSLRWWRRRESKQGMSDRESAALSRFSMIYAAFADRCTHSIPPRSTDGRTVGAH